MMRVTLLAVGKLGERYLREASAEYQKRLGGLCGFSMVEIPEYRLTGAPSQAEIAKGLQREGEEILSRIPSGAVTVSMCIEGRLLASAALADTLSGWGVEGKSHVVFVIGGSYGLSDAVKSASRLRLSMSPMTFPHQLARVMLLEQLYRAFSIAGGGKYHK